MAEGRISQIKLPNGQTYDINAKLVNGHTVAADVPVDATFINTDTLQDTSLATTTKAYITGVTITPTPTATAMTAVADTGIYTTTTAGELSAVRHSWNVSGVEKAHTEYDATNDCINFIFD